MRGVINSNLTILLSGSVIPVRGAPVHDDDADDDDDDVTDEEKASSSWAGCCWLLVLMCCRLVASLWLLGGLGFGLKLFIVGDNKLDTFFMIPIPSSHFPFSILATLAVVVKCEESDNVCARGCIDARCCNVYHMLTHVEL